MAWDMPGAHLFFHYAPRDFAVQIASEALYQVSERPHQRHGCGFFVTNLPPGARQDDALLIELFAHQRAVEAIEGVVILRDMEFRQVAAHVWFKAACGGEVLDLTEVLVGCAVRTRGIWTYSAGCVDFG
jgi:hypothetical protein